MPRRQLLTVVGSIWLAACGARTTLDEDAFLQGGVGSNAGAAGVSVGTAGAGAAGATGSGGVSSAGNNSGGSTSGGVSSGGTSSGGTAAGGTTTGGSAAGGSTGTGGFGGAGAPAGGSAGLAGAGGAVGCAPGSASIAGMCVVIPSPRMIAPLSTATVTSQTPTFHWALSGAATGGRVEIFRDRACTQPVRSFATTGTSAAPAGPLKPGAYYWRVSGTIGSAVGVSMSPVWEFFVGARSAAVDTSWGTTLDVNGDGYADAVVGTPVQSTASPDIVGTAAANVYLGGPMGLSASVVALPTPDGHTKAGYLNPTVASAGDVNGDGFGDLMVAVHDCVSAPFGAAFIYLGSAAGVSAQTPPILLTVPGGSNRPCARSFAAAGDVNGDGFADIMIGENGFGYGGGTAYTYLGSANGTVQVAQVVPVGSSQYLGFSVAAAGDVNGDGFGDVLVGGATGFSQNFGTVGTYLFFGGKDGLLSSPSLISGSFGNAVASANDVNGDGFADVILGAPAQSTSLNGSASVYLGSANGIATIPTTLAPPSGSTNEFEFGSVATSAGDVDGDGFADVLVAAPAYYWSGAPTPGTAYLYFGSSGGVGTLPTPVTNPAGFCAIAGAGDVNGDGFSDVVSGSCALISYNGSTILNSTAFVFQDSANLYLGGPTTGGVSMTSIPLPADLVVNYGLSVE